MEMGKAISQKIREAIRAKLIDLGNYVDEELPDYIMVMIANKKTEAQMKDDLTLFLGQNTDKFCGWLQGVLTKLQAARNEQKEKKEKAKEKKKKSKKKDEKKEKRSNSGEDKGQIKGEGGGDESSSKMTDHESPSKVAADSMENEQPSMPKLTEQPSTDLVVSSKPVAVQKQPETKSKQETNSRQETKSQPETSGQSIQPSEPVISLLLETNDILDEEIQMSDNVKKASTDAKGSRSVKSKDPAPKMSSKMSSVREEQRDAMHTASTSSSRHKSATPRTILPQSSRRKSPPVFVALNSRAGQIGQEVGAGSRRVEEPARVSVKARLGVPAVKRRAGMNERHRETPTMSKVVRVPAVPSKRVGPGSVIGQVIHGEEEDSDEEPAVKKVASTVQPRRRQPLPQTKQNSMALLKKAMTQATESTSVFPAAGQFSEPVRMIVRSSSQTGSMKIVARSIPADKEDISQAPSHQKKKAHHRKKKVSVPTVVQAPSRLASTSNPKATLSKTAVTVKPLGLMSRSRFNEAKERNFDAHDYLRVDKKESGEDEGVEEGERQEEGEEKEEETKESAKEESVEDEDFGGERQIITVSESPEKIGSEVLAEESEEELEMQERLALEAQDKLEAEEEESDADEKDEEEEESEIEVPEQVFDTRTTEIVRPLQYERLSELQKRVEAPLPPPRHPSPKQQEVVNPYFIVTMEGKMKPPALQPVRQPIEQPQRNLVLSSSLSHEPKFRPSALSRLDGRLQLSRVEPMQEMEAELQEEMYVEYEPMQYQQIVVKERVAMPIFERDSPIGRVVPTEPQVIKESIFSPPQPKVDPITFSLHESDEELGETRMEEDKVNERCKFWPACKNGNECPFVHPSTPCKTFPNCKYGDKCLFIHPNCKFDATCMNLSCPYTHATGKKAAPVIIQAPPVRAPRFTPAQSQTACKFYPQCNNIRCPFLHPKMCRFNRSCTRPDCKFTHSQVAPRASMKWTKEKTHISERKFASQSPSPT